MDDNRQQMIAQIKALKELQRRRAKRTFHDFLQYVNPKYEMKWYHRLIADYCQMLFEGVVPKLMVTCPHPQNRNDMTYNELYRELKLTKKCLRKMTPEERKSEAGKAMIEYAEELQEKLIGLQKAVPFLTKN